MSLTVDELFEYLARDGRWHSLNDLVTASHLKKHIVEEITRFFANYNFIQVNTVNEVKIDPELREIFISSIPLESEEEA